jgi:hypothetical protein
MLVLKPRQHKMLTPNNEEEEGKERKEECR